MCPADAPDWSATQYTRFEDERTRPARDLVAAIPNTRVARAADLGCGPGNSTELLSDRWPEAEVIGVDSSPDMLRAARQRLPRLRFEQADLAAWSDPGRWDVLLANAVLQWLPSHETLFPALLARLAPGGTLAVQMPDNLDEPSHLLMRETAAKPAFRDKLAGAAGARAPRHDPAWYHRLLAPLSSRLDIWRTTYFHPLGGPDAIVEWVRGTGLRPFLAPLDPDETTLFLDRYRAGIAHAYPAQPDGTVLLPFPRLFLVATR